MQHGFLAATVAPYAPLLLMKEGLPYTSGFNPEQSEHNALDIFIDSMTPARKKVA